jgi:hypothetical protein
MRSFAEATGGKACLGQNEMWRCYADTINDTDDYYLVYFYLPSAMRTGGWHKLKVKVNGHYDVRARQGFTVGNREHEPHSDLDVIEALRSPIENIGLQFSLELGEARPFNETRKTLSVSGAKKKKPPRSPRYPVAAVPFKITIARNSLMFNGQQDNKVAVRVDAAAVTEKNEVLAVFSKMLDFNVTAEGLKKFSALEFTFSDSVFLPAGKLRVRFAVQDQVGRKLGTVEAPIEITEKK